MLKKQVKMKKINGYSIREDLWYGKHGWKIQLKEPKNNKKWANFDQKVTNIEIFQQCLKEKSANIPGSVGLEYALLTGSIYTEALFSSTQNK